MKYGAHYAYWLQQWDADLAYYLQKMARFGFDLMEISGNALLTADEPQLKQLKQMADGFGMQINPCHGMSQETDTGSADPVIRRRGIDTVKRLFDRMALIGSKQLGGILYSYWPTLSLSNHHIDIDQAWNDSLESMTVIADEAQKRGIMLTLEVVNRFENFMFNNTRTALAYLDALQKDNVKLLLDAFHMNIEEDHIGDAIRMAGDRLGHFHIGECNRRVPGKGHMPWQEMAQALHDIHYNGGVVMEPFVRSGGEVADSVKVWRNLVTPTEEQLDTDIQGALCFVKSVFEPTSGAKA